MGLVLDYAQQLRSGRWRYRRRVPQDVARIIGQREFTKSLGGTRQEALAAYTRVHGQIESRIRAVRAEIEREEALRSGNLSDAEAYGLALREHDRLIAQDMPQELRDIAAETILDQHPSDPETGTPVGVSPYDRHLANLLRNGPEATPAPAITLEDATRLYLSERGLEEPDNNLRRALELAKDVLGQDQLLASITRDKARDVRDHMLAQPVRGGGRLSPASVRRYINNLNAVVRLAEREHQLPPDWRNPFADLTIPTEARAGTEVDLRDPLPPQLRLKIKERLATRCRVRELPLIWRLLAGTGCRLAEITGLRVEDVDLTGEIPHIQIVDHPKRRLKTGVSNRRVPLCADALNAARDALKLAGKSPDLFARYSGDGGPDVASAALMRHVRKETEDPRHVAYSLRHNMKDWLRETGAREQDQNALLGHVNAGVGDSFYGGRASRLRTAADVLAKALELAAQEEAKVP